MISAFTICSNNYYAQAIVLANSFLEFNSSGKFYIVLVDRIHPLINSPDHRIFVLEIAQIEKDILKLAEKFNIIELNTAVKPQVYLHLFNSLKAEKVIYLDPDIRVYTSLQPLIATLDQFDILVTPHILTSIPDDGKKPMENDFLNYGLYNLGFLALRKSDEVLEMLQWWRSRTYKYGFIDLKKGLFVDQLWINLIPIFHQKVKVLLEPGYNMGPWNLHERTLHKEHNKYLVNERYPLYFYHFSTFNPLNTPSIHPVFNRFDFANRPDLRPIYAAYADELKNHGFGQLYHIPCYYVEWRKKHLLRQEKIAFDDLPKTKQVVIELKKIIPKRIKQVFHALLG
jgi:lipopolysaccharide biosynthesis glycosyltransferase